MNNINETPSIEGQQRRNALTSFLFKLFREKPLGAVCGVITLVLLLIGIFADVLAPYGMNETSGNRLLPPSAEYWLGTDDLGRDLLSRVIHGARVSMVVGLSVSLLGTIISVGIGALSGYLGGKFDMILQRFVDAWLCFPALLLYLVVMSFVGLGMLQVILVLSLAFGIGGSRFFRNITISLRENDYVTAAKAIGCSPTRIFIRHIVINMMGYIIVALTVRVPEVILAEASLSFLGLGIPPPNPSWGSMLSTSARTYMVTAPWLAIWPGLALSISVYAVNMFGDALRDLLDPRLRGGQGSFGFAKK
jgi:peptide/nickel transport system permease protein